MQLSPNADPDTISRVYRILAARYHPDNAETGNSEMFLRLSEAYQILSNPARRASYDVRHRDAKRFPRKIFDQASMFTGREGESRKRVDLKRVETDHRCTGRGDYIQSYVGALCGWNAALRRP